MMFSKAKETTLRLLHEDVPAPMREAYNRIRVNLLARVGLGSNREAAKECPVIGLTTAAPCAGRRYLAANLAISFEQLGMRTLLIDADYREAEGLNALLGLPAQQGGEAPAADALGRPTQVGETGLFLLSRGGAKGNPADFVGSQLFFSAVHALRAEYDVIFVSLPPVTAYADAPTAAPALSGMVLGTVPGQDTRCAVATAVEALQTVGLPLYGMIACEE